jgi:HAD superfamily hydrolase (TIGR01509 family)
MLVIFDCDGVLIDSEVIFCSVDAEALTRLGHKTSAAEISERFAGIPHRIAWQQLAAELELQLPDDWVDTILLECERRFETQLEAIPGVVEALQAVRAKGHEICVASSTELVRLTTNLERAGVLGHVQPNVFSVSQVKRSKPAPDVFLFAASQMGFDPSKTIVIEDSVAGVTAARRAGIKAIGFTGGGHAYERLGPRLLEAGAEAICGSMSELAGMIARHDA